LSLKNKNDTYGGYFSGELDAAKTVNQFCEQLGISLQNPTIDAIPNEQYHKKEKTSQYKGVYWHRARRRWCVKLCLKGGNSKSGGYFKNEQNAAKRVNQLCDEVGIPQKNPGMIKISNEQSLHDEYETISNAVFDTKILKTDNDDTSTKKRKRNHEKDFKNDDKLRVEKHYFYDYLLK